MALTITHSFNTTIDSKSLIIKDLTPLSDYTSEIESVTLEDELSTFTTQILLLVISNDESFEETIDITSYKNDLRSVNGAILNINDLFSVETLDDDKYNFIFTYTILGTDYISNEYSILYQQTRLALAKSVIGTDWKDSFNYNSISSSSKYSLQIKSYYDQMLIYNENGLYDEAFSILTSLKNIL